VAICTLASLLIFLVYFGVIAGAFTTVWGRDWSLTLDHWRLAADRLSSLWVSVKIGALAGLIMAVGRLMDERPDIVEIDLNPVIASAAGVIAVDALVVIEEEDA